MIIISFGYCHYICYVFSLLGMKILIQEYRYYVVRSPFPSSITIFCLTPHLMYYTIANVRVICSSFWCIIVCFIEKQKYYYASPESEYDINTARQMIIKQIIWNEYVNHRMQIWTRQMNWWAWPNLFVVKQQN